LIPLAGKAGRENDLSVAPMDLTNAKNQPAWTLLKKSFVGLSLGL
jgi:hypothetical protein